MRDAELLEYAAHAAENAYAPYSHFKVGAAVMFKENPRKVYAGCNVENRSFGLTICAERNAVCSGIIDGCREIQAVAVAAINLEKTDFSPVPCGACLQFLAEFSTEHTKIILAGSESTKLYALLPVRF